MSFSMLIPVDVVETTVLTATNVAISESTWNSLTTYASGAAVKRLVDGLYRRFSSLQNSNTNKTPELQPDWWLDEGPVNAHAMFDDTTTTVTSNADTIEVTIEVPTTHRVDTVYLAALDARTVRIEVTDPVGGLVHDETYSLSDAGLGGGWWQWYTAPLTYKSELLVSDLPSGVGSTVTVTITKTGGTVACGHLVLGQRMVLGTTKWGVKTEIRDYSRWLENDFGDREFIPGAYRKLCTCELIIDNRVKDAVERELTRARAEPRLFIADEDFTSLAVFGTARWSVGMDMPPDFSTGALQIEGNT